MISLGEKSNTGRMQCLATKEAQVYISYSLIFPVISQYVVLLKWRGAREQ